MQGKCGESMRAWRIEAKGCKLREMESEERQIPSLLSASWQLANWQLAASTTPPLQLATVADDLFRCHFRLIFKISY
jgi:hypothetical protein